MTHTQSEDNMTSGWKTVKLGELGTIVGGATPSTRKHENYDNGTIAWITPKDLSNHNERFINRGERNITEIGLKSCSAQLMPKHSVLFSSRAPIGYVAIAANELCTNQGFKSIVPNSETDYLFLYYLLKYNKNKIEHLGSGTTFKEVSGSVMRNIEVRIPSLDVQRRIAAVLKPLDDKIELNARINARLERVAQVLFKRHFVRFEPYGGTMPPGWRVGTLGEFCQCLLGGTPARNKPEYWGGNIAWINSGEVNEFRITKPSEYITEAGLSNSSTKLLPTKTTVIAITGATLGQVSLLEIDSCANQSVVGILPNAMVPYEYVYPLINCRIKELMSHQTGGAQQHINKQNVESLPIAVPDKQTMKEYVKVVSPMYSLIANNCKENDTLARLRDVLLPRLMSGAVDVRQVRLNTIQKGGSR